MRCRLDKPDLIKLAVFKAYAWGLSPKLVCAIVEQESNWDPWAVRYESAFDRRYVLPMRLRPTQEILRAMSWGLMQVMGQTALEHGLEGSPVMLLDPQTGLDVGCRILAADMAHTGGDQHAALLRWNGGGDAAYPGRVRARMHNYEGVVA